LLTLPFKKKRSLSLTETIFLSIFFHAAFLSYTPSLIVKDAFKPMELDIDILVKESKPIKEIVPTPKPIKKVEALKPILNKQPVQPEPIAPEPIRPKEISQPKVKNNLTSPIIKKTIESYSAILAKAIAKQKKYPRIAQMRGWQGEIIIDLEIDGQGNLIKSRIKKSSEFKILDAEGMNMIKRASPFPKPPKKLESRIFNVIVPISFKLQN
jgi:periplasmic protein TonB